MTGSADKYPYVQLERREVAALLPPQYSKVLEIGCGTGEFRNNLDQKHEYWGVEPVEAVVGVAKSRLDRVLVGTYRQVEALVPDEYFDLVVCNDVIEHMPDHDEFLQSIRRKITKGGYLVASIPNVRYILNLWELLVHRNWEYKDAGILDRTHLRFFTRKSLVRTLRDNGYRIDEIAGINPYRPGSISGRALRACATLLFGDDIRYLQFGVRVLDERRR